MNGAMRVVRVAVSLLIAVTLAGCGFFVWRAVARSDSTQHEIHWPTSHDPDLTHLTAPDPADLEEWAAAPESLGLEPAPEMTVEQAEFFEIEIRPVLAQHCFGCHGSIKQRGGLRVDSRGDLLLGGNSGDAAIVPGDPDSSPLVQAVHFDGDVRMPPKGKLPEPAIVALTEWVRMGAPWPNSSDAPSEAHAGKSVAETRRSHWAFQPVVDHAWPSVKQTDWPQSPIDYFILARLEEAGLSPAAPADRRTLIRRVTFDLTGLPPTPEEVEAFVNDPSPESYATVVDRLLQSPRYGERWARYWLDLARYADTKGYVYDGEERRYPFSYTYRDYVIRSFNEDKPYDQFLLEQIAGDRLPGDGDDQSHLAAMGFLTLGRRFVNNMHDIIDDRLDVIFRTTQGLTISCARCHDHKFDPISTRDYYSLYGVLASSTERTVPLSRPKQTEEYEAYLAQLRVREDARDQKLEEARAALSDRLRRKATEYLVAVLDAENQPGDDFYVILSPNDLNHVIVRRWQNYLLWTKRRSDPVWGPWHAFAAVPEAQFAKRSAEVGRRLAESAADGSLRVNSRVLESLTASPPSSMRDVAERYGKLLDDAYEAWSELNEDRARRQLPAAQSLGDPAQEEIRQVLYGVNSPTTVPRVRIQEIETLFDEGTRVALNQSQAEVDRWNLQAEAPPHARILEDLPTPFEPHVFKNGNPKLKGDEVERQFLEVLSGDDRQPYRSGSGRLEMAQAIADRANPLTARVMVNRIWQHHFGTGLVGTPSNFGLGGERPTHPELLDYLANQFMQCGWSVKAMHRMILLSSTYQQSSEQVERRSTRVDPENRLLSRMNRRRLDFEATRDSLLAVSGSLKNSLGGRSVNLAQSNRRTVYGFVDRQNLPGLFATFDFANPDQHVSQRPNTTVPQQALFLLNNPFVMEQARALAARPDVAAYAETDHRIHQLYSVLFQREPTDEEREVGHRFLAVAEKPAEGSSTANAPLTRFERYTHALLLTNEFVIVD